MLISTISISGELMNNDTLSPPKKTRNNITAARISKSTSQHLQSILKRINKKKYGRVAKSDEVINKALTLLKDHHLEEIKELTYSSKDKLEIQHKNYCKIHGNISKDEFLQLLLSKALPELSQKPPE